jgi:hypothetical protein
MWHRWVFIAMTGVSFDGTQSRHTRRALGIVPNCLALLYECLSGRYKCSILRALFLSRSESTRLSYKVSRKAALKKRSALALLRGVESLLSDRA